MLVSLALIFLIGLLLASLCSRVGLPRILGMLVTGILLGPYVFNLLDPSILLISGDLRKLALVIILLKAGLSLKPDDIRQVGRPAILMAFVPACFEILAVVLLAPGLLGVTVAEAALMGSVLAAVSPAVIVPKMVWLMEQGYGTDKKIPQMILAGASLDDVFVIVLFSTFTGLVQGENRVALDLLGIPLSILTGIMFGTALGYGLARYFAYRFHKGRHIRNSTKVIMLLGIALLLVGLEPQINRWLPMSALLAVMIMAVVVQIKTTAFVGKRLSEKFSKLWIGAELLLFVLVGGAVDLPYAAGAGFSVLVLIGFALLFRVAGVFCCLLKTPLTKEERIFCMIAYLPKATVQAAIGSVPLSMGLSCGRLVLTMAVVAILITAPLGALGMDLTYKRLLKP